MEWDNQLELLSIILLSNYAYFKLTELRELPKHELGVRPLGLGHGVRGQIM